jgi:hypothetical protein
MADELRKKPREFNLQGALSCEMNREFLAMPAPMTSTLSTSRRPENRFEGPFVRTFEKAKNRIVTTGNVAPGCLETAISGQLSAFSFKEFPLAER